MESPGVVSVWLGKGAGRERFHRLLEYRITENGLGDFEACPFCMALGIDAYDPDQFGGTFFPKQIGRIELLFHGTNLASIIAASVEQIPPVELLRAAL